MGLVHTVGLVLHPRRDCLGAVDTIIAWARQREVTVLGLPEEVGRMDCAALPVPESDLAARCSLLVSLGGDGTMLRSMRLIAGRDTPVLGVNLGRLGFLAEIDVHELPEALSAVDAYQYTVEPLEAVQQDGKIVVTARLAGNFPGSPVTLAYAFELDRDHIISLEIRS